MIYIPGLNALIRVYVTDPLACVVVSLDTKGLLANEPLVTIIAIIGAHAGLRSTLLLKPIEYILNHGMHLNMLVAIVILDLEGHPVSFKNVLPVQIL